MLVFFNEALLLIRNTFSYSAPWVEHYGVVVVVFSAVNVVVYLYTMTVALREMQDEKGGRINDNI